MSEITKEQYTQLKQLQEDQTDYQFIQRIIQELTQSCALPLPVPAGAIPNLIIQAAQYFWQNDDESSQEMWYCVRNKDITRYGANNIIVLPQQILSIAGVFKASDSFNFGVMGDFSIERIIMNNTALASNLGGSMKSAFGDGLGSFSIADVTAALYEVQSYKSLFDAPLTYDYNYFSHTLEILGAVGRSDLVLDVYKRCKIQDMYNNYYFFRYCVALGLKSMATILGTFEYKLPGGISLNYARFDEIGNSEIEKIQEHIKGNHSPSYILTANSI